MPKYGVGRIRYLGCRLAYELGSKLLQGLGVQIVAHYMYIFRDIQREREREREKRVNSFGEAPVLVCISG